MRVQQMLFKGRVRSQVIVGIEKFISLRFKAFRKMNNMKSPWAIICFNAELKTSVSENGSSSIIKVSMRNNQKSLITFLILTLMMDTDQASETFVFSSVLAPLTDGVLDPGVDGERENACTLSVAKFEANYHFWHLGADGRTILK
jgi:hypothetical protein